MAELIAGAELRRLCWWSEAPPGTPPGDAASPGRRAEPDGDPPLVASAVDLAAQLQPNGVDLTARSIVRFLGAGVLGFANEDRRLPPVEEVQFDEAGWAHLDPGSYRVALNEVVSLPLDIFAIAMPRSSLLRMGAFVGTAYWDSGYQGRGECLLVVHNPHGLDFRRNARIVQIAFFRLGEPVENGYSGQYNSRAPGRPLLAEGAPGTHGGRLP